MPSWIIGAFRPGLPTTQGPVAQPADLAARLVGSVAGSLGGLHLLLEFVRRLVHLRALLLIHLLELRKVAPAAAAPSSGIQLHCVNG